MKNILLSTIILILMSVMAFGAEYRSPNFVVNAETPRIARLSAEAAEFARKQLAISWLNEELPKWSRPCHVTVKIKKGNGGGTTFDFNNGIVFNWNMYVQGELREILNSVIPHEVTHTIFASVFRRPLPRWADEGGAHLAENTWDKAVQKQILNQIWKTRYSFKQFLDLKEYPKSSNGLMAVYSQGAFLTDYLVQLRGKPTFLSCVEQAHHDGWEVAIPNHYGFKNISDLESTWVSWVESGMKPVQQAEARIVYQCGPQGCTRTANQGIGIGIFGGQGNQRRGGARDLAFTNEQVRAIVREVVDERVQRILASLTDEQKQLFNANAGQLALVKETLDRNREAQEMRDTQQDENHSSLVSGLPGVLTSILPAKAQDAVSLVSVAVSGLASGGPVGLGLGVMGWLMRRRKDGKDE